MKKKTVYTLTVIHFNTSGRQLLARPGCFPSINPFVTEFGKWIAIPCKDFRFLIKKKLVEGAQLTMSDPSFILPSLAFSRTQLIFHPMLLCLWIFISTVKFVFTTFRGQFCFLFLALIRILKTGIKPLPIHVELEGNFSSAGEGLSLRWVSFQRNELAIHEDTGSRVPCWMAY